MAHITTRKGMDIRLEGRPSPDVVDVPAPLRLAVDPREFQGVKPRLDVKVGDVVKRGTSLLHDKREERFRVCAPGAGKVAAIVLGPRRVVERIEIEPATDNEAETYDRYSLDELRSATRDQVLNQLLATGYLAFIRQRPFSGMADPETRPKSIFVNAMSTAPFRTDVRVVLAGQEEAFIAGLLALKPLTEGPVHLIVSGPDAEVPDALKHAGEATVHTFNGPHPAGNASVHIHHIDPISPGDTVWSVDAVDLIQIGRLFLDGQLPATRVVGLGGPGVIAAERRHYRVRTGTDLAPLLDGRLAASEQRVVNGDILSGVSVHRDGFLPFFAKGLTAIPEDRERRVLGWVMPGADRYTHSRAFVSTWLGQGREWTLGTSRNGSGRAMVLTGLYDRFMPMNIMVDFLVRAVLANDTDEAVKLGILETDPEDFALCAFACPSKMDLVGIVRKGLTTVEEEGL